MSVPSDSTALLPIRKIISVIWKPYSRQNRMPSSMLDCLDDPPPKTGARIWSLVILTLTLTYFVYHTIAMGVFSSNHVPDIEVVKAVGPTKTCGLSCNLEVITNTTGINITDIPIFFDNETTTPTVCEISMEGKGKLSSVTRNVENAARVKDVRTGGYHRPSECKSRHKIAFIVPYRNRPKNLIVFMFNIHPFLIKQKLEYRIFLIEQSGTQKFNKGRLFNAGFEQVQRFGNWSCLVFHDVDLLPLDERILYTCPTHPRHMSTTVVEYKQIADYNAHFGGVTAMTMEHFRKVNGYSNLYWGWGGEDFDMFWRLRLVGLPVQRYDREIAQYTMLPHAAEPKNPRRNALIVDGFRHSRYKEDGLSTVAYRVVSVRLRALYTHVVVDVNPNKDPTQ